MTTDHPISDYLDRTGRHLTELLTEPTETEDDFVRLATVGEVHRRALALEDDPPPEAMEAQRGYDNRLAGWSRAPHASATPVVSTGLEADLDGVFDELARYAASPLDERDTTEGAVLLVDVDEVLSVAAAAARCGHLEETGLADLAEQARRRAQHLAPSLQELEGFAAKRTRQLGPDERFPWLHQWIESLALASPESRALRESLALASPAHRAMLIDNIAENVEETLRQRALQDEVRRASAFVIRVVLVCRLTRIRRARGADVEGPADLGKDGPLYVSEHGIDVRVSDVRAEDKTEDDGGSLACIRVSLRPDAEGDLSTPGAVRVSEIDPGGQQTEVSPARAFRRPLVYWGTYAVDGLVRLDLPEIGRGWTLRIERPSA